MEGKEKIEKLAQTAEDRVLLAKVMEQLQRGQRRNIPAHSCFLSLREQDLVRRILGEQDFFFYGGHEDAERAVCVYLPDYLTKESLLEDGPIAGIRASFYKGDKPGHRDFLGSLMGCGIKRETLGDLLVGEESCDFFLLREIAPYVIQNLVSAGRAKLHVEEIPLEEVQPAQEESTLIEDTLASLRLDSVVGAGFRLSRTRAAQAISAGGAAIDGLPCEKPDKLIEAGQAVTLRGFGKIRLLEVGGQSRKGRLRVRIERLGGKKK